MSRIIIADDNKIERELFEELLTPFGHDIVLCENGKEVIKAFKNTPSDLILLDYEMPEMDGFEVCRLIRQEPRGATVPIVIISGYHEEEIILEGLNVGATDYLLKPMDDQLFIAKVKSYLNVYALHKKDSDLVKNKTVFAGRYRIERLIGCGAHSTILLATDQKNEFGTVAIKLLMESASEEKYAETFIEIANKFKRINCPNIVRIFDSGQYAGRLYLVMEYVPDGDLASLLKRKSLSEYDTAELITDIGNAITVLKHNNIIHFDIKPENILINGHTFVLADFGIMPPQDRRTVSISHTELWTTLSYVAPEFLDAEYQPDKGHTEASDIYSLGIVAYEAFTGQNPFESKKPAVTISKQINYIPPTLELIQPEISFELSDIIDKMLNKEPTTRMSIDLLNYSCSSLVQKLVDKPPVFIKTKPELHQRKVTEDMPDEEHKELHDATPASHPLPPPANAPSKEKSLSVKKPGVTTEPEKHTHPSNIDRSRYHPERNAPPTSDMVRNFASGLKLFFAGVLIIIILTSLSYGAYKLLLSESYTEVKGSIRSVICGACKFKENRSITDISQAKCTKCGKQAMAYTMYCNKCGNEFGFQKSKLKNKNLPRQEYIEAIQKLKTCPKCKSNDTEFAMTDEDLLKKLEKKK